MYKQILPLYFPRNSSEEDEALDYLPSDVGNEDGEPVIQERQIRILDKPTFAAYSELLFTSFLKVLILML